MKPQGLYDVHDPSMANVGTMMFRPDHTFTLTIPTPGSPGESITGHFVAPGFFPGWYWHEEDRTILILPNGEEIPAGRVHPEYGKPQYQPRPEVLN